MKPSVNERRARFGERPVFPNLAALLVTPLMSRITPTSATTNPPTPMRVSWAIRPAKRMAKPLITATMAIPIEAENFQDFPLKVETRRGSSAESASSISASRRCSRSESAIYKQ